MQVLSVNEFAKKVKSKKDLYEAVQRNGYYLPKPKSGIATEHYLVSVMDTTYWCPKTEQIRLRVCTRPPEKSVLLDKFHKYTRDKGYNTGVTGMKLPDKDWLLAVKIGRAHV